MSADHETDDEAESLCPPISPKHAKYIAKHLKKLREQCNGFNHCLDELYSKENTLLILQGKDIELKHVCSLVSPNSDEEEMFACNPKERSMIRVDLRTHLDEFVSDEDDRHVGMDHNHAEPSSQRRSNGNDDQTKQREKFKQGNSGNESGSRFDTVWDRNSSKTDSDLARGKDDNGNKSGGQARLDPDDHHSEEFWLLGQCIQDTYPDRDSVAAVCKLQRNSSSHLCGSKPVHHAVESFFNKQLRHLQCTCDALPSVKSKLPLYVGGAAGGFVLLCILVMCCCWVSRSKKRKSRNKRHSGKEGAVNYHGNEKEENASFYSEISDVTMPLNNYRREMARQNQREEQSNKPDLPTRYAKVPANINPSTKELVGSIEYLELCDAPRFSLAEVDYDDHSSGNDPEVPKENPTRGSYFFPLGNGSHDHEDRGYETLSRDKKAKVKREEGESTSNEAPITPDYFVLEERSHVK